MKKFKAIIFDLDGTLLYTLSDLHNAVNFALSACAYPIRTLEETRLFVGDGVRKLIERAAPNDINSQELEHCFNIFLDYYKKHLFDTTAPYEGVDGILRFLKDNNIPAFVVSNKADEAVKQLCSTMFKNKIIKAYGVADESEKKPSTKNVFKLIDEYSLDKDSILYVGDSAVDVQTAENAGLNCVLVTWGFRTKEELSRFSPLAFIDKADELKRYFE